MDYVVNRMCAAISIFSGLVFLAVPPPDAVYGFSDTQALVCIGDACFDRAAAVAGRPVPLRGAGLFEWVGIDLYTAAFYAPEGAESGEEIPGGVPKQLMLHYHQSIKKKYFIDAAERVLRKNPQNDIGKLRSAIDQMYSYFQNVNKGDRYALTYEPGRGTELSLNGRALGVVPGEDFSRAFFGIWLSRYSINVKLRNKLLGLKGKKGV